MSEEWSFEKDDFLTTTPYEALYAYHKEPFTHAAKMEELAAYSVSKGFKGFKTMYKKYVESLKAQSGTIYIDNVTNFTNQPLELNAGDWEADDSGIFKKNGYNDEVACPHPIMPVERLVIKRTGSMDSLVGPAVTSTRLPARSFPKAISRTMYSNSTSGSGIFPAPVSPQARYPVAGVITSIP